MAQPMTIIVTSSITNSTQKRAGDGRRVLKCDNYSSKVIFDRRTPQILNAPCSHLADFSPDTIPGSWCNPEAAAPWMAQEGVAIASLLNSALYLPHSLLHLKAPGAVWTNWSLQNAPNCFFYWRRIVHLFPSLPPFIHSTCYFHPSNAVDKWPIQSLGSVQTCEHFLASFSWSLHRFLPFAQPTGQTPLFYSTELDCSKHCWHSLCYWSCSEKCTSSHCPVVYKNVLKCKSLQGSTLQVNSTEEIKLRNSAVAVGTPSLIAQLHDLVL